MSGRSFNSAASGSVRSERAPVNVSSSRFRAAEGCRPRSGRAAFPVSRRPIGSDTCNGTSSRSVRRADLRRALVRVRVKAGGEEQNRAEMFVVEPRHPTAKLTVQSLPGNVFPWHHRSGAQVPYESLVSSHAPDTPDTTWTVSRYLPCLFLGLALGPGFNVIGEHIDASRDVRLRSSLQSIHVRG